MTEQSSARGSAQDGHDGHQEEDVLQTIIENSAAHLAYLDPEFNYIRANSAYARGLRLSLDALIGKNHFVLFPQSTNRAVFEVVRDVGEPAQFWATPVEIPGQPERGVTYWDWSLVPVKDSEGTVTRLVLSSTEVTELIREREERERLQEEVKKYTERLEDVVIQRTAALRASEARFRTIFESSTIGIALLNAEGQILAANPMLQTLLGYRDDELVNTFLAAYYHKDGVHPSNDQPASQDVRELEYGQTERRYAREDGQIRWGEVTLSPVKSTKRDAPKLAIAMLEDITEERLNRQALLHAERLTVIGRLGASLAHEINNPLQTVIGCLGLADEMLGEEAPARGYLKIAMDAVERAADIVTYLRDLGREPVDKLAEPTDVNALVERVLFLTEKRCQDAGVNVDSSLDADLPAISVTPDRIQQVFLNVILNALEAMPEGGRLSIRTESTGLPRGVRISFADTGVGIAFDELANVFEPFSSARSQGMGLGLYISKNIIETHAGKIEVDSRNGKGATFTVWLPS